MIMDISKIINLGLHCAQVIVFFDGIIKYTDLVTGEKHEINYSQYPHWCRILTEEQADKWAENGPEDINIPLIEQWWGKIKNFKYRFEYAEQGIVVNDFNYLNIKNQILNEIKTVKESQYDIFLSKTFCNSTGIDMIRLMGLKKELDFDKTCIIFNNNFYSINKNSVLNEGNYPDGFCEIDSRLCHQILNERSKNCSKNI